MRLNYMRKRSNRSQISLLINLFQVIEQFDLVQLRIYSSREIRHKRMQPARLFAVLD